MSLIAHILAAIVGALQLQWLLHRGWVMVIAASYTPQCIQLTIELTVNVAKCLQSLECL